MPFDPIHSVSFDWSSSAPSNLTYDQYTIDIMVNEEFRERLIQAGTDHTLTVAELFDGDSVYLEVIPTDNEALLLNDVITTSTQNVAITNFHNQLKKIEYSNFYLNGSEESFYKQNGAYYFSGQYIEKNIDIDLSAINPRDSELLDPSDEPFYSGIDYLVSTPTGIVESGSQRELSFIFPNDYNQRNLDFTFVLQDVYNSGTTGFLHLEKPIPSVNYEVSSFSTGYNADAVSGVITISLGYSNKVNYFDYTFYNDTNYTGIIGSGRSLQTYSTTGLFPLHSTGYLKVVPYDWFGSGNSFYKSSPIITYQEPTIEPNNFSYITGYNDITGISFIFNTTDNNDFGSYINYSIHPNSNFIGPSNATGSIHGNLTGYNFNIYDLRNHKQDHFYYKFNLLRSGSNLVEDTETGYFYAEHPKVVQSGIAFDYVNGYTTVELFDNYFNYDRTELYYSGQNDSSFQLYTGEQYIGKEINPSVRFELRDTNTSNVLDSGYVTGSGLRPSLSIGDITFPSLEASVNCVIQRSTNPVESVSVYKKTTFEAIDGDLPIDFVESQRFNDYLSYPVYETGIPIGHYIDMAPINIPARDTLYTHTTSSTTGTYLSGLKYVYRFVPYDGYGSGHASLSKLLNFTPNTIAQSTDSELVATESRVTSAEVEISEIKGVAVQTTGNQTIVGQKTFSVNQDFEGDIYLSGFLRSTTGQIHNGITGASFSDVIFAANSASAISGILATVYTTGDQNISGHKTFEQITNTGNFYLSGDFYANDQLIDFSNIGSESSSMTEVMFVTGDQVISGNKVFANNLNASGNLSVTGSSYVSGSSHVSGDLNVSGNFNLAGRTVDLVALSNHTQLTDVMFVTGDQMVHGNKTFASGLATSGNLSVTGSSYVSGSSHVSGDIHLSGALYVSGRRLDPSNLTSNGGGGSSVTVPTVFPSNLFFGNSAGVFYSYDSGPEALNTLDAVVGSYVMPTTGYIASIGVSASVSSNDSERYHVQILKNGSETTGIAKSDIVDVDYTDVSFYQNTYIPFVAGDTISAQAYNGASDNMEVYETTVMVRIYTP